MSFGGTIARGIKPGMAQSVDLINPHKAGRPTKIQLIRGRLASTSTRLHSVRLMNRDAIRIIDRFNTDDCLLYLDPPYTHCSTPMRYLFDVDQQMLIDSLQKTKAKALLSGYPNDAYTALEDTGWLRIDMAIDSLVRLNQAGDRGSRTESLWINPACQKAQRQLKLF